jgi:Putative adhesin
MERNRQVATWAGTAAGIALAVVLNVAWAHAGDEDSSGVREEFHQTYPLAANGRIGLDNINGAVHISVWDQNQVKVDAIKRADDEERLKNIEIRVHAVPESISIETHYRDSDNQWGRHRNPGSVEYTLTVPRTARLDEIKLINGALDVTGVAGEIRASCINGTLKARDLGGRAKLETINGTLDAEFGRVSSAIDLSSVNGSLQLTLPSDAKASIEASTVHGGIDNDFGLHTNNHRWVGHDLRGELGGGGTEITLHNVNGSIDVRHAGDGRAMSPAKDTGERSGNDDEM